MSHDPERRCPSCESEEARAIVERLCKLTEVVYSEVGYEHPSDCFCGAGGNWDREWYGAEDFRHDLATVEFIEAAVAQHAALAARVKELEDRIARAAKALDMMSTQGKGERRWVHWEERAFKARRILRGEDDTTGDTDG